jgi:hypothetical protein
MYAQAISQRLTKPATAERLTIGLVPIETSIHLYQELRVCRLHFETRGLCNGPHFELCDLTCCKSFQVPGPFSESCVSRRNYRVTFWNV